MSRSPGRTSASDLIAKFLGPDAAAGGPFALLGLTPETVDDMAVLSALRDGLDRTAGHPEGGTPEADEVRLALHAAAAQLLDPATCRAMVERWSSETPQPSAVPPRPRPPSPPPDARLRLQHDVLMAIAASGGWNARARRRLLLFAQSRGANAQDVAGAVSTLTSARPAGGSTARSAGARHPGRPSVTSFEGASTSPIAGPSRQRGIPPILMWTGILVALAMLGIIAGVIVLRATVAPPPPPLPVADAEAPKTEHDPGGQLFPWQGGDAPRASQPEQPGAPATTNAARIVSRLVEAVSSLDADRATALDQLAEHAAALSRAWPELDADSLRVALSALVDAAYQLEPEELDHVLGKGEEAGTEGDILERVWQAGVLNRLSRERNLPISTLNRVDSQLSAALGGIRPAGEPAFETGAIAAAISLASDAASSGTPQQWEVWVKAARTLGRWAPTRETEMLLAGLSEAMSSAEPSRNAGLSRIVPLIPWHRDEPAQRWLLARFDALDTPRPALAALTRELATRSSVPGLDVTMVLTDGAGEAEKRALRDRYARVLGRADDEAVAELGESWQRALAQVASRAEAARTVIDRIAAAHEFSRLSEAAALRWRGLSDEAASVLSSLDALMASLPPSPSGVARNALSREEPPQWALAYLRAGNEIPTRMSLLANFPGGPSMHPADAEVLLADALRGSPAQVRDAARAIVVRSGSSPAMVNAMLEAIATAPRTPATAEIVTALTSLGRLSLESPRWREDARRALVERLLEQLAEQGELARIDELAELLAASHAARAAGPVVPGSEAQPRVSLVDTLARERAQWRTIALDLPRNRAYPDSLTTVDAEHVARSRLAEGDIQRAVAEMAGIVRLMGLVVAAERPARAATAWDVVSRSESALERAAHVSEQVLACERAAAELWALRLTSEPEETP